MDTLVRANNILSVQELIKVFGGKYKEKQIREKLRQLNLKPRLLTPEERGKIIRENSKTWPQLCRKKINHDFFKTWSQSMAYVVGLWFADGNMSKTDSNKYFFNLSLKQDDGYLLESILEKMGSNHSLREEHGSLRIQISSKTIHTDLLKLGGKPQKSLYNEFPMVPEDFLSAFIRGYFDGDGSISKSKHIIKILGTKEFLTILNYVLLSKGICASSVSIHNPGQASDICHRLTICGKNAIKFCEFIYADLSDEDLYLKRKYERYTDWLVVTRKLIVIQTPMTINQ